MGGIVYAWTHPYTRKDKPFDNVSEPVSANDRASGAQKTTNKSPQVTKETSEDETKKQRADAETRRAANRSTRANVRPPVRSQSAPTLPGAKTDAVASIPNSSATPGADLPEETNRKEPAPSPASPSPQASSTDQASTPAPSRPEVTPTEITPRDMDTIVEVPVPTPEVRKPNLVKRFFVWFANLFKKKPKNGHLFIGTMPSGFPLKIDLQNRGVTRSSLQDPAAALELPAGKHTVEIIFPNGERWSREIDVVAGRKHYVSLEYHPKTYTGKSPCPYPVNISAPVSVNDGDLITFTSDVTYGGSASLNYTWTVSPSDARIVSGVGTATITVDSFGFGSQRVTANLVVDDGSGEASCRQAAQAETSVIRQFAPPIAPRKFDVFQSLSFNDDKARLDNLAIELQNSPDSQASIIIYGSYTGEAERLAKRSSDYLGSRGIDSRRVIAIDGGCREAATIELWIVPQGATPPQPSAATIPCREKTLGAGFPSDDGSTASATPSPSPSPGATPTPPPSGEKDRITINYPLTVCFRHPETIKVVYDRVKGDFKVETRVENRVAETIVSPGTSRGRTFSERVPEGVRIESVTAIPTLVGEGFIISSVEKTIEKSLEDDKVVWEWQITPKFLYRSKQPINLAFQVNLYDQNNNLIRSKDWVRQKIEVDVFICTNGELAAISAFFGAIAVALVGFGWKVMAFAPALFVRSVYNIYGGQQGAVGDQAQAINVTQQSGKTDSDNKGEKTDGKSGEG